jgi:hypothetical protein
LFGDPLGTPGKDQGASRAKPDRERRMFFTFPKDARWNVERQTVEIGVEIGEYSGAGSRASSRRSCTGAS